MTDIRHFIPKGSIPLPCRGCGVPVFWVQTPEGARIPVGRDHRPHWIFCKAVQKLSMAILADETDKEKA